MTLALLAMSHSPLLEHAELDAEVSAELEAAFAEARRFVHEFDPDVIVNFAPDHYNGFFYRLMPPFCVGYAAESIGDYGSQTGRLDVPEDLARALAEAVIGDGIDLAVSLDMQVDHGAVQPIEILYGDITAKPFVPIFINSVAPPFTPVQRIRLLGEAIGRHLATLDKKVLLIASGGLSHDPPVPRLATATPAQRAMLMGEGGPLSPGGARRPPAAGHRRRPRLRRRHRRRSRTWPPSGTGSCWRSSPPATSPRWTRWTPDEMTRIAGNSAHEVRTWIAGYAALGAAGRYPSSTATTGPSGNSSPASGSPPSPSTDVSRRRRPRRRSHPRSDRPTCSGQAG